MRIDMRLCGVGGQGIVTMGYILGRAGSLYDKKDVVMTEAYGPEITGGFVKVDLVLADSAIDYPLIDNPEILVVMSQDGWERDSPLLRDDATVIYERDMVKVEESEGKRFIPIPAVESADELGKRVVANVIMMGAVQSITGLVTDESLQKALLDRVPKGTEELNMKALEKGREIGAQFQGGE